MKKPSEPLGPTAGSSQALALRPASGLVPGLLPEPPEADRTIPEAARPVLERLARAGWAKNTVRAYSRAWRAFESWCQRAGRQPLPATIETVALYVAELVSPEDTHQRRISLATFEERIAAIRWAHSLSGVDPPPTAADQIKKLLRGARRELAAPQHQAAPITFVELPKILAGVDRKTLAGKRDAAIVLVGLFCAFRRSELAAIHVEHLREIPGGLEVFVPRSKTDQHAKGATVGLAARDEGWLCPVRALREWLSAAGISSGPVFRGLTSRGGVRSRSINEESVNRIVKRLVIAAGFPVGTYSAHSLRAGLVTQAFRDGLSEAQIQGTSRHKSTAMLARYRREADPIARGASAAIGKKLTD